MDTDELALMIPIIAIGCVFTFLIITVVTKSAASVARSKHTEQSRREIAAYIAEGSMTPDEGERLLKAGPEKQRGVPMLTLANIGVEHIAVVGGLALGAFWIVFATIDSIVGRWQRERSRREIAAYIAEGSMTPEDGERLMKADKPWKT